MKAKVIFSRLSFQTKLLVPVILVMSLLLAFTMWIVNGRFTQRMNIEAGRSLMTANAVFANSKDLRSGHLLSRYSSIANEPRVRSVAQSADPATIRVLLADLKEETLAASVVFTGRDGTMLSAPMAGHGPDLHTAGDSVSRSVRQALGGQAIFDFIALQERLFEIVSVPVIVSGLIVGALTFADEIGQSAAEEFKQLTHSELAFFIEDRPAAATLLEAPGGAELTEVYRTLLAGGAEARPRPMEFQGEHFLGLSGRFDSLGNPGRLGYLLLSSYEPSLLELRATQKMLLSVSLGGILAAMASVWLIMRRVTRPLRKLQSGVEAVGGGDFSHRVAVTSHDEFGGLAQAFNRMTENLKTSRAELESTVHTLRTTQAQLVQSEKLSAIGEFVAGVTHELNNPLTSVIGFAQLLKESGLDEQHQLYLTHIVSGAQRCHKIVQSLLSFARQHPPERKLVDINEIVDSTLHFVQYELRTGNIEVERLLAPNLPRVLADPHLLQQVFLNLLNNARQALESARSGGRLRVATEPAGDRVQVTVQDNGPGIPSENLTRIFNPFFTTKEIGKGTGLGLSLSLGIIEEHGGTIRVANVPGGGARFTIDLPVARKEVGPYGGPGAATVHPFGPPVGHAKRVLVIDDEESLLALVEQTLAAVGYQVDVAADGTSAFKMAAVQRYDAILCDNKMPGYNGQQIHEHFLAVNPDAAKRLIFMTGDVVGDKARRYFQDQDKICLTKPFSLSDLRESVRKVAEAG